MPTASSPSKVSVITPTHNRAALLPETIESVLDQGWPGLEYIVVDDGSTDGTDRLLKGYGSSIRVLSQQNLGEPSAVNRGFEAATGDLLVTVNSDDTLLPGYFERTVAFMTQRPDVLAGFPDWRVIGPDSRPLGAVQAREFDYAEMLRRHEAAPGPCALIRRRGFELTRGRSRRYRFVSDFDFWLRLGLHGSIARIPHTLATWRDHSAALSRAERGDRMAAEQIEVVECLFSQADLPAWVPPLKAMAMSSAHYAAGVILMDTSPPHARRHFLEALRLSPRAALFSSRGPLLLAGLLLPPALRQPARRFRRAVRRWLGHYESPID
jgi:hypothetical protein